MHIDQNGLTLLKQSPTDSPIVTTYPSVGGRCGTHGCVFQGRKMREVATTVYSRKTSKKTERVWSTNFKCEWFGSCFYARGRYWNPTRPSQGTTAFNQACNIMSSICFIFPFLRFYVFCIFFIFLWLTRVFPSLLRILNCDEEIRPTQFLQN